jgi:hypothetical protein
LAGRPLKLAANPMVPAVNSSITESTIGQRTANSFGMIPPVHAAASTMP